MRKFGTFVQQFENISGFELLGRRDQSQQANDVAHQHPQEGRAGEV
jgi:hypothetical protein